MQQDPPDAPNGFFCDGILLQPKPIADGGLASTCALAFKLEPNRLLTSITATNDTKGKVGYAFIKLVLPTDNSV